MATTNSKFGFAYDTLKRRIMTGFWKIGDKMPDELILAGEFGCSRGTINKVFSRLSHEKILERRPRFGTRVKSLAQCADSLETDLDATVFICPSEQHEIVWRIAQGYLTASRCTERRALVLSSGGDLDNECEMVRSLGDMGFRGAVICPVISKPEDLSLFTKAIVDCPLPVVLVCLNLPGSGRPFVTGDSFSAGYELASHLISRDITRIGYLTNYAWTQSARDSHVGYLSAMREARLEIKESWVGMEYSMDPDYSAPAVNLLGLAKEYLVKNPDLQGVVCGGDFVHQACMIAAQELGISVPNQLKIAGINSTNSPLPGGDPITAYIYPSEEIGKAAFEILEQILAGESVVPKEVQIPGRLVTGCST